MSMTDGVIPKGRCVVLPESLKLALEQLHINHMGIEKTKLLAHESIYWININGDIEKHIKSCCTCLDYQQTKPKEKIIHHEIPVKPWEMVGADTFTLHNKNYICTVDYHSKFPVIKKMEEISADSQILMWKFIFLEYSLSKKIMSDSGGYFILDKFKTFCRSLNIKKAFLSSYHHQNNGQVKACIKWIK